MDEPVIVGVHGAVAEHYGVEPDEQEPHTTTLDSFAGRRQVTDRHVRCGQRHPRRRQSVSTQADAVGEIELDGKTLVVRCIHVTYQLPGYTPTRLTTTSEPRSSGSRVMSWREPAAREPKAAAVVVD